MERFTKIFFAAILLLTISSCDKKSCKNVSCAAPLTCYEGQCLCPDGYEGTDCSVLSSDKYSGSWQVSENCGGSPPNFTGGYTSTIFAAGNGNSVNEIEFSNFLGGGYVYGYIQNTDPNNLGTTIYIPGSQNPGNGVTTAASYGTYYPAGTAGGVTEIIINMNYTYGGYNYTCQETMYKM